MRRKYIFCHGFGFTNKFWNNLMPYFTKQDCIFLESNYFVKSLNPIIDKKDDAQYIGIGHSLGFFKLCTQYTNIKFKALIGLNAFNNFLGFDNALRKLRLHEYVGFKKQFLKNPKKELRQFYQRCGMDCNIPDNFNIDLLKNDLNLLGKDFNITGIPKTLIINSIDDIVVPLSITKDNFLNTNALLKFTKNGKHALGFLKAEDVFKSIMEFLS